METPAENYQLKWSSYTSYIHACIANSLVAEDSFADVALVTMDGHKIMAHRFVLAYSSQYLSKALKFQPKVTTALPIMVVLPQGITYKALKILVKYMYSGEATVSKDILNTVLKAGDILKVKGLYREASKPPKVPEQPKAAETVKNPPALVASSQKASQAKGRRPQCVALQVAHKDKPHTITSAESEAAPSSEGGGRALLSMHGMSYWSYLPADWVKHVQTHTDMLPAKRRRRDSPDVSLAMLPCFFRMKRQQKATKSAKKIFF